MKARIFFILIITLCLTSCSIFDGSKVIENNRIINLQYNNETFNNEILVIIYTKDSLELRIPLVLIENLFYSQSKSDENNFLEIKKMFLKDSLNKLITIEKLKNYTNIYCSIENIFESNYFLIYNKMRNNYILEVEIKHKTKYKNSEIIDNPFKVIVNNNMFWFSNSVRIYPV